MRRVLLASSSPRRRDLLRGLGWKVRSFSPDILEVRRPRESPRAYCSRLALEKARRGLEKARPGEIVIAADTCVVLGTRVLEKPASPARQARGLRLLSGRRHKVLTALVLKKGKRTLGGVEESGLRFSRLTPSQIRAYVASGEGLDAAGGYKAQGALGSLLISEIQGSFSNVVGLPLEALLRLVRRMDASS